MRKALLLCSALVVTVPAQAQTKLLQAHASAASFTGPGDIVASATAWYGLRGYSAAYAAPGTGKSVNVRRASDNATQDIVILATGAFDVASYNSFVGSDGTASCTLSGTTGACSGASGTVHINDPVTGVGITNPCVITTASNTAPIMSIAGTTTSCGTVGAAVTFTFQVAGFVAKAYDQSGNVNDTSQVTAGLQPQFLPLAANSGTLATMFCARASSQLLTTAGSVTIGTTGTISAVSERNGFFTNYQNILASSNGGFGADYDVFANKVFEYQGTLATNTTASDSAFHAMQFIFTASTTSFVNVDGTPGPTSSAGSSTLTGTLGLCQGANGNYLQGYISEAGIWTAQFSAGQNTSMHTNQAAYWGTP